MIPLALFVIAALWCALTWLHWRKYKREITAPYTWQARVVRWSSSTPNVQTIARKRDTGTE